MAECAGGPEPPQTTTDGDESDGLGTMLSKLGKRISKKSTSDESIQAQAEGDVTDRSMVYPSGSSTEVGASGDSSVKTASSYEYDFTHAKRGVAHIFVNQQFDEDTGQNFRKGAEQDMATFSDAFRRLGYEIKPFFNKTAGEILKEFNMYCAGDHSDEDSVIFAFSTHGDQQVLDRHRQKHLPSKLASDIIYGKDGILSISTLAKCLTDENCPTMANKPKLFFFQACRGDELAENLQVSETGVSMKSLPKQINPSTRPVEVPLYKDFFMAFSAPPGFYSFRRAKGERRGSWFVLALCDIIKERGYSCELMELMTALNHRLALDPEFTSNMKGNPMFDQRKIIPWVASMLVKSVRFTPKSE